MAPPPRPVSPAAFLPPSAYGASATLPAQRPLSPRPRAVVGPPPSVSAVRASSWTGTRTCSWTRCTSPLLRSVTPTHPGSSPVRLPVVVSADDVRGGGGGAAPSRAPLAPPLPWTTMAADRGGHRPRSGGRVTAPSVGGGTGADVGVRPSTADGDRGDGTDGADTPPSRRARLLRRVHVPRGVGSALVVLRVGGARSRPGRGGGASWAVDAGTTTAGEGRDAAPGRRGIARPLPVRPKASAAGVLAPPSARPSAPPMAPPSALPLVPPSVPPSAPPSAPSPAADPRSAGVVRPSSRAPVVVPPVTSQPVASPAVDASAPPSVKARRGRKPRLPRLVSAPPTTPLTVPLPPPPVASPAVKPRRGRPRLSPPSSVKGAAASAVESLLPATAVTAKRGRGRPRLSPPPSVKESVAPAVGSLQSAFVVPAKPRRGRPRLSTSPSVNGAAASAVESLHPTGAVPTKRGRGRPRLSPPPPVRPAAAHAVEPLLPALETAAKPRRGRPPRVVVAASSTVETPRRRGHSPASMSASVGAPSASAGLAIEQGRGRPSRVARVEAVSTVAAVAPTASTPAPLVLLSPLHPLPLAKPLPVEATPRARKSHGYWNELRNVETELVAANVALGVGHKGKIMPRLAALHSVDRGDLIAAIAKHGGLRKVAHHLGWRKQPSKKQLAAAAVAARRRERGAPVAGKDE